MRELEIKCLHCGGEDFTVVTGAGGFISIECDGCKTAKSTEGNVRPNEVPARLDAPPPPSRKIYPLPEMKWTVYFARDPLSNAPIYVGVTMDFDLRRQSHAYKDPIADWTAATGLLPTFEAIATFPRRESAAKLETALIEVIPDLVNKNTGGGGNYSIGDTKPPASLGRPWLAEGVSRSVWYRKRRKTA